jgi:hypothetical protein
MTNAQLNDLSLTELRELHHKVFEMIKLKKAIEGKLNADTLEVGMIVRYKGAKDKLKDEKFEIIKISKVNAVCQSLLNSQKWNINLANIEVTDSVENERFINEKEPDANFSGEIENKKQLSNKDIGLRFCKQVGDGRGFWIDEYTEKQKEFFISIGFIEDRKALTFKSTNTNIFDGWTRQEEQTIHTKIINHFGLTKIQVKQMSFADMI